MPLWFILTDLYRIRIVILEPIDLKSITLHRFPILQRPLSGLYLPDSQPHSRFHPFLL